MGEDAEIARGARWSHRTTVDLRGTRPHAAAARLARRLGAAAVRRFGVQTPLALGYGLHRTLAVAREVHADLYIGHQEVGLWVAVRLHGDGRTAGVDIEDWYSEDLLPDARAHRPLRLLRSLEATALGLPHVTTTSHALASALARRYDAPSPTVVYNAFPLADRGRGVTTAVDRRDRRRLSLHWVSQTIGAGRGIETLFAALDDVEHPVEVHIRGQCTPEEHHRLRALFPAHRGHELRVHPLVPNGELLARIAEHDVGLALEPDEPDNKRYTVSNKILQYLLAGLAVVATDTAGQAEVAARAGGAIRLCRPGDVRGLAQEIRALVSSPDALRHARAAAVRAAEEQFCWERQAPALVDRVRTALVRSSGGVCVAS